MKFRAEQQGTTGVEARGTEEDRAGEREDGNNTAAAVLASEEAILEGVAHGADGPDDPDHTLHEDSNEAAAAVLVDVEAVLEGEAHVAGVADAPDQQLLGRSRRRSAPRRRGNVVTKANTSRSVPHHGRIIRPPRSERSRRKTR